MQKLLYSQLALVTHTMGNGVLCCDFSTVYVSLFIEANLIHSSLADGLSVSLSFRQSSTIGRSGWEGSTRLISFLRRSDSGMNTNARPVGNLGLRSQL